MENWYELLGVSKDATQDEIKKAYREKAKQHHPDAGGDAEMFKKINAANEVLSDPEKRKKYDSPTAQSFWGHDTPDDIFSDFVFGQRNRRRNTKPVPLTVQINVDIKSAYMGTEKTFTYKRYKLKGEPKICTACNGHGVFEQRIDMGMGRQAFTRSTCPQCGGQGKIQLTDEEVMTRTAHIPAGFPDGDAISYQGDGNEIQPNVFGDMVLIIQTINDDRYSRDNQHLIMSQRVPFPKLILGGDLSIDVFGKIYKVTIKSGENSLQTLRLRGLGFKFENNVGDLYINIIPDIPNAVNEKEKRILSDLMKQEHFK